MCPECYEKHAFYESIMFQSCAVLRVHQILQRQWHVVDVELLLQH